MPRLRTFLPVVILIVATGGSSRADFITSLTVNQTQDASGLFAYEYTLENLPSSDRPAIQLSLDISEASDLQSISSPAGWDVFYTPGDFFIAWFSLDPASNIVPG